MAGGVFDTSRSFESMYPFSGQESTAEGIELVSIKKISEDEIVQKIHQLRTQKEAINEEIRPTRAEVRKIERYIAKLCLKMKSYDCERAQTLKIIKFVRKTRWEGVALYDAIDCNHTKHGKVNDLRLEFEDKRADLEDSIYKQVEEMGRIDGELFVLRHQLKELRESGKTA